MTGRASSDVGRRRLAEQRVGRQLRVPEVLIARALRQFRDALVWGQPFIRMRTIGPQLRGSPRNHWALVESDQYDGHNRHRSGRTERPAMAQSTRNAPRNLIEVG